MATRPVIPATITPFIIPDDDDDDSSDDDDLMPKIDLSAFDDATDTDESEDDENGEEEEDLDLGELDTLLNIAKSSQRPQFPSKTTNPPIIPQSTKSPIPSAPKPTTAPKIPPIPKPTVTKGVDVAAILSKMPGMSVTGITPAPTQVSADINDILHKESDESDDDFEARRILTLKLASIPDYTLNNETAVVAGNIMMKKSKLGITYDLDIESVIAYLIALLQR